MSTATATVSKPVMTLGKYYVENSRLIGKQDHYAAAFGSINFFKFYSDEKISVKPVDENSKNVNEIKDGVHPSCKKQAPSLRWI